MGVEPQTIGSAGTHKADITARKGVASTSFQYYFTYLPNWEGKLKVDSLSSTLKTFHMLSQFEDPPIVSSDPFKDPITIQNSMV